MRMWYRMQPCAPSPLSTRDQVSVGRIVTAILRTTHAMSAVFDEKIGNTSTVLYIEKYCTVHEERARKRGMKALEIIPIAFKYSSRFSFSAIFHFPRYGTMRSAKVIGLTVLSTATGVKIKLRNRSKSGILVFLT